MKLDFNDTEETFDYAIRINRCIEFIYKRKRYWLSSRDKVEVIFPNKKSHPNGEFY